ncbi:MAG: rhodanese-like domain-containing protein [Thermoleophilia bacterium]
MDTILMIAVGVAGGMLLLRWRDRTKLRRAGVVEVTVPETEKLIAENGALVVDVREPREYAAGRIPQSRHIPMSQFSSRLGDLDSDRDRPIVVSCRSGRRSASVSVMLCRQGFSEVYNLKGGINAWTRADRKIER